MRDTLFRPEVMQARSVQWLGGIRIGRPPSFAWMTGIALVLLAGLVAFALLGQVSRKARVSGVLLPTGGLIGITAPQAGSVAELLVKEGEEVRAGQPLLKIRTERRLAQGDVALLNAQALAQRRQSLDTERLLQQQQARQRTDALNDRLRSLQAEERQAQGELDSSHQRAQLAQKSLDRFNELARSGYVSTAQVQQKQEELLDLQMRERSAERNLQALQRDAQAVRADLAANETSLRTALALLDRNVASLAQESNENEARGAVLVQAPQDGRVATLSLHAGQSVLEGQALLSLVPRSAAGAPDDALEAQLFAPSRTSGFVQPGQQVWLRYAAYPYQKFGMARGRVVAVSQAPLSAQELPTGQSQSLQAAAQASEPLYRIRVALDRQDMQAYGASLPLKPGMSLDADVLQQRQKVWEWVMEPILAVSGLAPLVNTPDDGSSPPAKAGAAR
ncbi:HlyD family efflux transporter periplasmic adaptor subunit [Pelomonas sp. APW6]|uniref:HlyD family efflux transporter periplasmic adaptor subunit n=1 Tax=Roseateles subflavus TaxID=3053353 RepID=A0ABT7LFI3_9BURK|nr:HlyD family efflux transporter periplasmic adaptor subunit [Pelomonas sp. APW6]MDL5030326.1 HlyD family efflux transporter periplasmic adaptor subunit [Pelomonas sp. APW6]